ncbi:antitoxin [Serinicoccus kebangsaanensis]|uniref:antitoxin n=1 Tax=Serinicoccus kebangsaanensis TaxID=2602069 RepID=UPI00124DB245|nr:antitoxin [Serinicoccus kebangsaanensis]
MPSRKFAALGAAVDAARRFARKDPEKTQSYLDKAADFADRQTKGKYSSQIRSASDKASQAALGHDGTQGGSASGDRVQDEVDPGTQGRTPPPPPPPPGS